MSGNLCCEQEKEKRALNYNESVTTYKKYKFKKMPINYYKVY